MFCLANSTKLSILLMLWIGAKNNDQYKTIFKNKNYEYSFHSKCDKNHLSSNKYVEKYSMVTRMY